MQAEVRMRFRLYGSGACGSGADGGKQGGWVVRNRLGRTAGPGAALSFRPPGRYPGASSPQPPTISSAGLRKILPDPRASPPGSGLSRNPYPSGSLGLDNRLTILRDAMAVPSKSLAKSSLRR